MAVTSNRGRGLVAQRPGANPQIEFQYYRRKQTQHRTGDLCKFNMDHPKGEIWASTLYLSVNVCFPFRARYSRLQL